MKVQTKTQKINLGDLLRCTCKKRREAFFLCREIIYFSRFESCVPFFSVEQEGGGVNAVVAPCSQRLRSLGRRERKEKT
jgi:hypothetical protein